MSTTVSYNKHEKKVYDVENMIKTSQHLNQHFKPENVTF